MELADQPAIINIGVVVPMNGQEQIAKSKMLVQVPHVKIKELVDQLDTIFSNVLVHRNSLESGVKL
jgi:hypothetical protein